MLDHPQIAQAVLHDVLCAIGFEGLCLIATCRTRVEGKPGRLQPSRGENVAQLVPLFAGETWPAL